MTIPITAVPPPAASPMAPAPDGGTATAADQTNSTVPAFSIALTLALANGGAASSTSAKRTGPSASTDAGGDGSVAGGTAVGSADPIGDDGNASDAPLDGATTPLPAGIAGSAAAAPGAIAPAERRTVSRTLDVLTPEFRDRLERVIDRMESEFGYKVEVVETFRSQSRQDSLFARGRTEPGQVVTWTRASNHTRGQAADLVIDGSYTDSVAYARLGRIAGEEGLRTLGARDPGHVELPSLRGAAPGGSRLPNAASSTVLDASRTVIGYAAPSVSSLPSLVTTRRELEPRTSSNGAPFAAPVATVARVAQVAEVAHVAIVAPTVAAGGATPAPRPAPRARGTQPSAERQPSPSAPNASALGTSAPILGAAPAIPNVSAIASSALGRQSADQSLHRGDEPNERPVQDTSTVAARATEAASDILRDVRDGLLQAVAGSDPNASASPDTAGPSSLRGTGHADMTERIARLLKVQDAAADRPLSQVLLRLERPDGGEDRVRVDLRGTAISATLDVGDQAAADRLGANMQELQRALEHHGFDAEALTVRTTSRSAEATMLARAAGAAAESDLQRAAASGSPSHTSSRDRGARHDEQRPSPDSHNQRSRRDRKGDR